MLDTCFETQTNLNKMGLDFSKSVSDLNKQQSIAATLVDFVLRLISYRSWAMKGYEALIE